MLWYLHLAAVSGVVVTDYADTPVGTMVPDTRGGGGQFTRVVLRPAVTVTDAAMCDRARTLHDEIGAKCFIARSVNFPVDHEPTVQVRHTAEAPRPQAPEPGARPDGGAARLRPDD